MNTLNDRTAKIMLGHIHRIGMSLSSFENELQGTGANTEAMKKYLVELQLNLRDAQQEIVDLRDGKS